MVDPSALYGLQDLDPGGTVGLLEDILNNYISESHASWTKLRLAWSTGDRDVVHFQALALKGSSAEVGAKTMVRWCERLASWAKGEDISIDFEAATYDLFKTHASLRFVVQQVHPSEPAAAEAGSNPPPTTLEAVRVLLAEDNIINRRVCASMLKRLGCEVQLASNGRQAIDLAMNAGYDIILMDCFMPELDGLEATREIRARGGNNAEVPIIAFTAVDGEDEQSSCMEAGMNDVIFKPVRIAQLSEMLHRWAPAAG